jgi:hypothetical protein
VALLMPVVWAEECRAHVPGAEIWVGVTTPGTEVPERAIVLRDAVVNAGARLVPATAYGDETLELVHDRAFLDHLAGIYAAQEAAGFPTDSGQDRVVPYIFPTSAMLAGLPERVPTAIHARAGLYCYDTMTPSSRAAARRTQSESCFRVMTRSWTVS